MDSHSAMIGTGPDVTPPSVISSASGLPVCSSPPNPADGVQSVPIGVPDRRPRKRRTEVRAASESVTHVTLLRNMSGFDAIAPA